MSRNNATYKIDPDFSTGSDTGQLKIDLKIERVKITLFLPYLQAPAPPRRTGRRRKGSCPQ